ncbi:aminoglycoside phosphotransferase [Streptomyces sp. NBC_00252]|uniref:aminoglycoside phosphotransferase n=1 Tax=Streptomyces sp. NBC_00252 TaxID=2975691 RepID=UPI002E2B4577|nr:aminoglycoside phosphotransferase [Streptomyces sp. NBC_00252]
MATSRITFEDLPLAVLAAVERQTGPVVKTEAVSQGLNSELAVRVFTELGSCFVKGLRADHRWVGTQRREAEVNPFLQGIAPTLFWQIEEAGWVLLGFENLQGHHADYSPDSPDLTKVAELLRRLGEVACPEIQLRQAEQRLGVYAAKPTDLDYFAGNSLLHTDLNDHNVIVDSSAYLVDWAWATRGAAWLDAGYWVVWLMAAGQHEPQSAERWASEIPSWRAAPTEGITAFAQATANVWEEIAGDDADEWTARMLNAARRWATFRQRV